MSDHFASHVIRPLSAADARAAGSLHRAAFPDFFMTSLGPRFLDLFYATVAADESTVCLAAVEPGCSRLTGLAVGPLHPAGFFRRVLARRLLSFATAAALAAVRHPSRVPRLFRALRYRGDAPEGPERALLSSIAVSPDVRGRGVGAALLRAWVDEAARRGAPGCYLTTDQADNATVNRFYLRAGFRLQSTTRTPEGRALNRYVLDF